MGVKLARGHGCRSYHAQPFPIKRKRCKRLGAHRFVLTSDAAQVKEVTGYFDFIFDTVSAEHDYPLSRPVAYQWNDEIYVGVPPSPTPVAAFSIIFGRKSLAGSLIGGLPETQEMLDFCAEHNIVSDIELIRMDEINEAYERMVKGDVRYRFCN